MIWAGIDRAFRPLFYLPLIPHFHNIVPCLSPHHRRSHPVARIDRPPTTHSPHRNRPAGMCCGNTASRGASPHARSDTGEERAECPPIQGAGVDPLKRNTARFKQPCGLFFQVSIGYPFPRRVKLSLRPPSSNAFEKRSQYLLHALSINPPDFECIRQVDVPCTQIPIPINFHQQNILLLGTQHTQGIHASSYCGISHRSKCSANIAPPRPASIP